MSHYSLVVRSNLFIRTMAGLYWTYRHQTVYIHWLVATLLATLHWLHGDHVPSDSIKQIFPDSSLLLLCYHIPSTELYWADKGYNALFCYQSLLFPDIPQPLGVLSMGCGVWWHNWGAVQVRRRRREGERVWLETVIPAYRYCPLITLSGAVWGHSIITLL